MASNRSVLVVVVLLVVGALILSYGRTWAVTPAACANAKVDLTLRNLTICGTCTGPGCPGGGGPVVPTPVPPGPPTTPYTLIQGDADTLTGVGTTAGVNNATRPATFPNAIRNKTCLIYDQWLENIFTGKCLDLSADKKTIQLDGPVDATTAAGSLTYCTDMGSTINNAITAFGAPVSGGTQTGQIIMQGGLCTTITIDIQGKSIDFGGQGMGEASRGGTHSSVLIWAGLAGHPVINEHMGVDNRIHDFSIRGNSRVVNRPSALVQTSQTGIGTINSFNRIYNMNVGGTNVTGGPENGGYVNIITDTHVGDVTVSAGGKTYVTGGLVNWLTAGMANGMVLNITGFRNPINNGIKTIVNVDATTITVAEVEADEVNTGSVAFAHNGIPTADRALYAFPAVQNDRTVVENFRMNLVTTGIENANSNAVEWSYKDIACNRCGTTFYQPVSGHYLIQNLETLSNNLVFYAAQDSKIEVRGFWDENTSQAPLVGAAGDHYIHLAEFKGTGGSPGGYISLQDAFYDGANAFMPPDGRVIFSDPANNGSWRFFGRNVKWARTTAAATSPSAVLKVDLTTSGPNSRWFTCHDCQGLTARNFLVNSTYTDTRSGAYINVCDASNTQGSAVNGTTTYFPGQCWTNWLYKGHAQINPQREDQLNQLNVIGGAAIVQQLVPPVKAIGSPVCAVAGAASYFYRMSLLVNDGQNIYETPPGPEFEVPSCAATISTTNYTEFEFLPPYGGDEICVYRSDTGGPDGGGAGAEKKLVFTGTDADPATGCLRTEVFNVDTISGTVGKQTFIRDTVASNSGGASPQTRNSTGQITVQTDPIHQGNVLSYAHTLGQVATVADLPSFSNSLKAIGSLGGYWRLGETAGNFVDSSGNGNTCVAAGGITYSVPGAIQDDSNTQITLNGTTGTCAVASAASLPTGDTFSAGCIVSRANSAINETIMTQKVGGFQLYFDATTNLINFSNYGTGTMATSTQEITDATEHFIAVTKNGANTARVYVDGTDVTNDVADHTIAAPDASLWIGSETATAAFMKGNLDECFISNVAATPQQIKAIYLQMVSLKNGMTMNARDVNCQFDYSGGLWKAVDCGIFTVAAAPTCNTNIEWAFGWITDADGCTDGQVPIHTTGSVRCPVGCDGTSWKALYSHGTPTATATPSPTPTFTPVPTATPT